MATYRPPGTSRREREERDRRRERLVIYGVVGALVIAAIVVLVGLYTTQYQPPRAHVLTVGDRDYNASDIARRALYEMRYGDPSLSGFETAVSETLDRIEDTETVLARAPAIVGEVPDDEVRADLYARLALEEDATESVFVEALAEMLADSRLSREELEEIVRANILVDRLRDVFVDEYGDTAPQVLLSRIRVADESAAEDIRDRLHAGADFAEVADELSSDGAGGGDIGWLPLAALSPAAREALADLPTDAVSAIVRDGLFYDVYLVRDRDDARAIDEAQRESLGATRFLEWIEDERATVEVEVDLSPGEERWILDRLISDLRA